MRIEVHGLTHPGRVRGENQDRILVLPDLGCYVVCDGMGGQRCGELAAELAIEVLQHYIDSSRDPSEVTWPFGYNMMVSLDTNRLLTSIRLANRQVSHRAENDLKCASMGTTVAAVLCRDNRVALANVGDSRIYRLRAGTLEQLSCDDTMAALMVRRGVIPPEGAASHPMRSILTQAIGSQAEVEVHVREEELLPKDTLLLCSDGPYGCVSLDAMAEVLNTADSVEEHANGLLECALAERAADNVSLVILRQAETRP